MSNGAKIGRPKTRLSRKQLVTSRTGKTYYRYIYDDKQLRRTRPEKPRKPTSVTEAIKKGKPIPEAEFKKRYPGKSYKRYREKLKRVKERLL